MSKFIIEGGCRPKGEVKISGMKNAATPIIAATVLTKEECVIGNIPRIKDVEKMLEILRSLGSRVEWSGEHELTICNKDIKPDELDEEVFGAMRSSILFLGPLLQRFGSVSLPEPGGCIIGNRPISTHLYALESLGAKIEQDNSLFHLKGNLKGTTIILPEFSVTATENLLMASVLATGKTVIKLAAAEPHVSDLIAFLNKIGARIRGRGTHTLEIEGVAKLGGAKHVIIPDQIEAGTFTVLGAVTHGDIVIENAPLEYLDIILLKLKEAGVNYELGKNSLRMRGRHNLKAFKLQTLPYPGFPTDLQAPFGVLATQCEGTSLIHDPMYEGRMNYAGELIKMGANGIVADPHRVIITGPTPLFGREINSFDLRAGATLIIAGIIAEGQTIIKQAEMVDRGYEKIDERLRELGIKIRRVE